ncbi:hypothetical protein L484_009112 [Morus notabilis]|uniref:Uncharacterized protein n=1 Tax=Morus notabilis TaxID=981085 RepID=W9R1A6_9ROSA|nr:hypothetical protein L484_009112 [Morus notabilis]
MATLIVVICSFSLSSSSFSSPFVDLLLPVVVRSNYVGTFTTMELYVDDTRSGKFREEKCKTLVGLGWLDSAGVEVNCHSSGDGSGEDCNSGDCSCNDSGDCSGDGSNDSSGRTVTPATMMVTLESLVKFPTSVTVPKKMY